MNSRSATQVLWTLREWRCEVSPSGRLALYRATDLIASHDAPSADRAAPYAEAWEAAISELIHFDRNRNHPIR